jgi:uncharacterized SAM-binding protein YcdF (DUF218 family)
MPLVFRPRRWLALVSACMLLLAGAVSWVYRVELLQETAQAWIVSDPAERADAVAVLGGGLDTRPFAAAGYYHQGLVPKILVSSSRTSPSERLGVSTSQTELNRAVLLRLGVPETSIEIFGHELSSTFEESVALREWAERAHATTIIVPTEAFSSRRVRWTMQHNFAGTRMHIQVPALEPWQYNRKQWWRREEGLVAFQNEIVKYIYYRLKYGRL